ncbi:MAG: ABC transporter substrate-binding protein [Betaproteobacteria bacterium]|nr:ABC transporter substrate-binding protein [Betaproteobacteria bacterium]
MKSTQPILAPISRALIATGLALLSGIAAAQIKIGVTISTTGPAASLGIPERNAVALMPRSIAGVNIEYIVLDDGSDPVKAVQNARKLVSDDKVDVLVGSSTTPNSLAMIDVSAEGKTPQISIASSLSIVDPVDAKRHWIFKTPQNDAHMMTAMSQHMSDKGVRKVGLIGFNDAYGEGVITQFSRLAPVRRLDVVVVERYARTDTSVTGQVLKLMAANPDAILIAASGTPAVLPAKTLKERGYKGQIYFTDGVVNNDFLRVGGKDIEGSFLPVGPVVVAKDLPDSNPIKKVALDFTKKYEDANGKGSMNSFAGHGWNAWLMLERALPAAIKSGAKPGTEAFRAAVRDNLENIKELVTTHGVMNTSKTDHMGFDQRARVMAQIKDGGWVLAK